MQNIARVALDGFGWVEYDMFDEGVRVGDRTLPGEIHVHSPGAPDQPMLDMDLAVVDGVPQCRSLTIASKPGSREVRTLDVRAVTLEDWVEYFFSVVPLPVDVVDADGEKRRVVAFGDDAFARGTTAAVRHARRNARRKITPEFVAEVARIYRENANGRPVEAVQAVFGGSYRTASAYVQRARRDNLLPPTTPGKVTS